MNQRARALLQTVHNRLKQPRRCGSTTAAIRGVQNVDGAYLVVASLQAAKDMKEKHVASVSLGELGPGDACALVFDHHTVSELLSAALREIGAGDVKIASLRKQLASADTALEQIKDKVQRLTQDLEDPRQAAADDPWAHHPEHPRSEWRLEVRNGDTCLGYATWVRHQKESKQDCTNKTE